MVLVLAALVLVPLHVRGYTEVSPIDELQHIDYLYEVPGVIVSGELVEQEAMGEAACRGLDAPFDPPPCDAGPFVAADFPEGGYNTAYIHPPTYYALTRAAAEAVSATGQVESLTTAGRLAGAGWLALGLLVTYAAGRRLGAGPVALLGPLLLVAATPAILMPSATVNPDGASLAVGGACLLLVLLWSQGTGRGRWGFLLAAGLVAEAIKLQNLVVLCVLAVFVLAPAVVVRAPGRERARALREGLLAVAALAAPAVLVAGAWSVAIRAFASVPPDEIPMSARFLVDGLTLDNVVAHVGAFISPLADPYVPQPMLGTITVALLALTTALLVAGFVSSALLGPTDDVHQRCLGLAVGAVALLGAPFLVLVNYVGQGQYIAIPSRYALTVVPVMAVLLALGLRHRWTAVVVLVLGAGSAVLTALHMAFW